MKRLPIDVDRERLQRSVRLIAGERSPDFGSDHLSAVEGLIARELESYGLEVERDAFQFGQETFHNVIGRLGAGGNGPLVIIGAHFDAVGGTPGADDNASGVVVLLETARLIARAGVSSPVMFCAFNLEEFNMIGSSAFARKLKSAGAGVQAMISLEMVGYTDSKPGSQKLPAGLGGLYPDRGEFIGVIGNWKSNALLRRFSELMREARGLHVETLSVPGKGALIPGARLSDHAPFWDCGYPALMVTDTAFYRNPHYHLPTDTPESLDYDFMTRVCEGVTRAVMGLAAASGV